MDYHDTASKRRNRLTMTVGAAMISGGILLAGPTATALAARPAAPVRAP